MKLVVANNIATITLNRPENRNSMTPDVLGALAETIQKVRTDRDIRCVIVTGTGRSFCAGADFKSAGGAWDGEGDFQTRNERSYAMYQPFLSLLEVEVPVIAAMQGHAIGGGLGLAVVCDIRVAAADSKYGVNFVRLGLHPGMATTWLLPRLMGMPRAVELLLTGRIITGTEAPKRGWSTTRSRPTKCWREPEPLLPKLPRPRPWRCVGPSRQFIRDRIGIHRPRLATRRTPSPAPLKPRISAKGSPPCSRSVRPNSKDVETTAGRGSRRSFRGFHG